MSFQLACDPGHVCKPAGAAPVDRRNTARTPQNEILFTTMNPRFPEWGRFRGAEYTGLATHDPLAQNLAAGMLSRGALHWAPREVLRRIAFFASNDSGLVSARTSTYSRVCRPDRDGQRLLSAARLSRKLRRLLRAIPPELPLGQRYRYWTERVAECLCIIRPPKVTVLCPRDPTDPRHSSNNRLFLRGLDERLLGHKDVSFETRPAYLPNAATFAQWCACVRDRNDPERLLRFAEQIDRHSKDTVLMLTQYIRQGKHSKTFRDSEHGCSVHIQENLNRSFKLQQEIQEARFEAHVVQMGADLYSAIAKIGLNGAERDWFYMLNPDQHH